METTCGYPGVTIHDVRVYQYVCRSGKHKWMNPDCADKCCVETSQLVDNDREVKIEKEPKRARGQGISEVTLDGKWKQRLLFPE